MLLNCKAHANIHIVVIRCIVAFTLLSVFVAFISLLKGKRAAYIYIFIQTPFKFGCTFSEVLCVSSLELHPGGLNYSLVLQRHIGQTAVLQALALVHMKSNDD